MSTPAHAVAAAVLLSAVVLGQQVIPAGEDPHYKRLLFTAHLRLFEIAIPAGAATLDHSHDHDIVTVAVGESRAEVTFVADADDLITVYP